MFSLETDEERETRRLGIVIRNETELRDYYAIQVLDAVESSGEFGYVVEYLSTYETVVVAAIKQFTQHSYIIGNDTTVELEWKGKSRLIVYYVKPPSSNHPNSQVSLWYQVQHQKEQNDQEDPQQSG